MPKTYEELRATPAHVVCEHNHSQRSCPHCECSAADEQVERLKARVAELQSGLHEISASLPVHESKDLDAGNVDDVCRAVKLALRRYADDVERLDVRVAALQSQNSLQARTSDREHLLLKNRVVVRQGERDKALARAAEREDDKARDAEVISQLRSRVAKAEQAQRRLGRVDLEQTNRITTLEKLVESHSGSGESVAEMKERWRTEEYERARVGQRGKGEKDG